MSSAAARSRMSMEEFLNWELRQPERWEFDGFAPRAMVGGTVRHNLIVNALAGALRDALQGRCAVFTENVKLRLAHSWRYPDIMVVCSKPEMDAVFVDDPSVVVEILSSSTAKVDRLNKNTEYASHEPIKHYVLIEQDVQAAEVYSRDGGWQRSTVVNDEPLVLSAIGVTFPLSAAYLGLDVPPYDPDEA